MRFKSSFTDPQIHIIIHRFIDSDHLIQIITHRLTDSDSNQHLQIKIVIYIFTDSVVILALNQLARLKSI